MTHLVDLVDESLEHHADYNKQEEIAEIKVGISWSLPNELLHDVAANLINIKLYFAPLSSTYLDLDKGMTSLKSWACFDGR